MKNIKLFEKVGAFAENKDIARDIRTQDIIPCLDQNEEVLLDFKDINSATQSFIHSLLSNLMRQYGNDVLDKISFKSCNPTIQKIIAIVTDYLQERE